MGSSSSAVAEKDGPAVVKLDAATARALEKVAKASGKSTTQLTRAALREFLAQRAKGQVSQFAYSLTPRDGQTFEECPEWDTRDLPIFSGTAFPLLLSTR